MATLAIGLGIYAYLILALGLVGWLLPLPVGAVTGIFVVWGVIGVIRGIEGIGKIKRIREYKKDWVILISLVLLVTQVVINFLGAISPELSFDALWYHLTSAKLYVQNQRIFYIPGWLLWPANIPRLVDMFYVAALLFSNEILAKIFHFFFGILSAIALFNLLKRYFNLRLSLLGVLTFYTMLVVGWQSTTAYVDLARTFFEILALAYFLRWIENKKESAVLESAVFVGLAISSKILAFGTLISFLFLILILRRKHWLKTVFGFALLSLLVAAPWFVQSFINTGNPVFPLFGNLNQPVSPGINPNFSWFNAYLDKLLLMPWYIWKSTILPDDIISPIYLIFLPLILMTIWKQVLSIKVTALYVFLGMFLAPVESNRYILPYLPGLTLLALSIFNSFGVRTNSLLVPSPSEESRLLPHHLGGVLSPFCKCGLYKWLIGLLLFVSVISLGSRIIATKKFVPYLLGRETKEEFLSRKLNFAFGDFYDIDNWFSENIQSGDLVLIYGIHNLYYVNFPFIHESWAKSGTYFTHILVGNNGNLPEKFGDRLLLYQNPATRVKVYLFGEKYE